MKLVDDIVYEVDCAMINIGAVDVGTSLVLYEASRLAP